MSYTVEEYTRIGLKGFEAIVSAEPRNRDAWFALGLSYMDARRFQDAVGAFDRSITPRRGYPARAFRGRSRWYLGMHDDALTDLAPMAVHRWARREWKLWLAEAQMSAGRCPDAARTLLKVIARNGSDFQANRLLSKLQENPEVDLDRPARYRPPVGEEILEFEGWDGTPSRCKFQHFHTAQGRTVILIEHGPHTVGTDVYTVFGGLVLQAIARRRNLSMRRTYWAQLAKWRTGTFALNRIIPTADELGVSFEQLRVAAFEELVDYRIYWGQKEQWT